ncbi:hypothetical protein MtrunA17_Chr6g0457451 [Medicago truncatula]|uniref:Uncharacterized protein n=2 Tax=Medicago truncatula TaxID=3880 RepID=A0A396HCU5_MEDTR|nr:hypothetical protein MtrunA17_Chr6g0457451 [Medicago truncatula]
MEADSWTILIQPIVVVELMDQVEKSDVDSSMPENVDMQSMRGKMVLELLKILLENVGAVFRTSERLNFQVWRHCNFPESKSRGYMMTNFQHILAFKI